MAVRVMSRLACAQRHTFSPSSINLAFRCPRISRKRGALGGGLSGQVFAGVGRGERGRDAWPAFINAKYWILKKKGSHCSQCVFMFSLGLLFEQEKGWRCRLQKLKDTRPFCSPPGWNEYIPKKNRHSESVLKQSSTTQDGSSDLNQAGGGQHARRK